MSRCLTVTESRKTPLELSDEDAEVLNRLGRQLASDRAWWGDAEGESDSPDRSVVYCQRHSAGLWDVVVREAVGIVGTRDVRIQVNPKIPRAHFLYLAVRSPLLPRIDEQSAAVAHGGELTELIVRWLLSATERLLRAEPSRGYVEREEELEVLNGQLLPLPTAQAYYSGRLRFSCRFEEFSEDIPLNRVIKAAAHCVASNPWSEPSFQKRARAILTRMEGISLPTTDDMRVTVDRLTEHYRQPLAFAKYLLAHAGVQITHGTHTAWSFLIRTPELIECGLRTLLQQVAPPEQRLHKGVRRSSAGTLSFNPDIVVNGGEIIADIKYKIAARDWFRPDLNQVVTFATAFRARRAALIYFSTHPLAHPVSEDVGDLPVDYVVWKAYAERAPAEAAAELVRELQSRWSPIMRDKNMPLAAPTWSLAR